jgi:hypothetical protein
VDEKITVSRLEYEAMQRGISDLRLPVQQLRDEISLLKGDRGSKLLNTTKSYDF